MGAFTIPFRLEITDGTDTVDLVNGSDGLWLEDWKPATVEYKGGGIYQDSPLVDERRLVNRAYSNIIDTFAMQQANNSPDTAIRGRQKLRRLLEKAADYQTADWQTSPVYMVAQGRRETNTRYALIVAGRVPSTLNPYGATADYVFTGRTRSNNEFDIVVEHGIWTANPPTAGENTCLTNGGSFNETSYGPAQAFTASVAYIFYYDGTFSSNLAVASLPTILMPSGASEDELYLGSADKFSAAQFVLSSGQNGTADTVWEYWAGSQWATVDNFIQDKTGTPGAPGEFSLQHGGQIVWEALGSWSPTTVNGVSAYWVRMRQTGVPFTANITISQAVAISPLTVYCAYLPFVTSHDKVANITNIYYYDDSAAAFGDNLMNGTVPYDFHNVAPGTDDMIYFGINTALTNSGPFSNLIFNLSDKFEADSWLTEWQYWDGSAWEGLTVSDKTAAAVNEALSAEGENGVFWEPPSDWAAVAVNSITGWWVRLAVKGASNVTLPEQTTRHIYTISWSYVEIGDTALGGDIRALAQINLYGNGPSDLAAVKVRGGERAVSRGENFRAWINFGGTTLQNPTGITLAPSGDVSYGNDLLTPTGKTAVVATGAGAIYRNVAVLFADTIADEYQGEFRLFVVAKTAQALPGYTVQYRIADYTLQTLFTGDPVTVAATTDYSYYDLGRMSIKSLPAIFYIYIDVYATAPASTLSLAGIWLQPVDEFAFETTIPSGTLVNGYTLRVDGLGKRGKTTLINNSGLALSPCRLTANGTVSAQSNARTRFWFAFSRSATEASLPVGVGVGIVANPRYLEARGDQ